MALVGLLALSACSAGHNAGAAPPTSTAEVTASSVAPPRDWAAGEDYDLVFSIQNMNGMGGSGYNGEYSFKVRNGGVESCSSSPLYGEADDSICEWAQSPIEYFLSWANRFEPRHTTIEFDPVSGLPSRVFYDDPALVDEEHEVRLVRFEQIP